MTTTTDPARVATSSVAHSQTRRSARFTARRRPSSTRTGSGRAPQPQPASRTLGLDFAREPERPRGDDPTQLDRASLREDDPAAADAGAIRGERRCVRGAQVEHGPDRPVEELRQPQRVPGLDRGWAGEDGGLLPVGDDRVDPTGGRGVERGERRVARRVDAIVPSKGRVEGEDERDGHEDKPARQAGGARRPGRARLRALLQRAARAASARLCRAAQLPRTGVRSRRRRNGGRRRR